MERIGKLLAPKPLAPVCDRCGRERPFLRTSRGKVLKVRGPCLCAYDDHAARQAQAEADRQALLRRREREASIPPPYRSACFGDFADAAPTLTAYFDGERPGLLTIIGPCGTGKTRALYAFLLRARAIGRHVTMHYCPELLSGLSHGRDGAKQAAALGASETLLLLDDVGAEAPAPWEFRQLAIVLHHREQWSRPTVLTTNLEVEALSGLSERIASRVAGGTILHLLGEDRRLRKPSRPAAQPPF